LRALTARGQAQDRAQCEGRDSLVLHVTPFVFSSGSHIYRLDTCEPPALIHDPALVP
jgi:hypothetical protein